MKHQVLRKQVADDQGDALDWQVTVDDVDEILQEFSLDQVENSLVGAAVANNCPLIDEHKIAYND